jgi:catechol 2,3-dioxygenase-like lactoylglutathione lyase family enzyme
MIDRFHHFFIRPADYDRSLGFYRDALGWSVTRSWGGEDGKARGAILSGGGVKIVISEADVAGGGARPDVFLDIHDIDARFRSLPSDADVVIPPQATPWGTRWFVVRDPDGNLIAFEEVHRRG